ncbi:LPXTG cell wall anchor domain-containing protein, partial [Xylophilus sp. Kf1]|nr:LPXTG cell wall anchor domain-containing protein [Xylophilus sp. Kf1]
DKSTKDKLPDTGANEDYGSKGTLLGTLFAGLGALLLGKRRKNRKNKN